MARSKGTVTVKISKTQKIKVFPVIEIDWKNLKNYEKKIQYLIGIGLKQRKANAARALVQKQVPEIINNLEVRDKMIATMKKNNMDEAIMEKLLQDYFADAKMTLPTSVTVKAEDIFPDKLDAEDVKAEDVADEDEEETEEEETEETEEVEEKPVKKNGNGKK